MKLYQKIWVNLMVNYVFDSSSLIYLGKIKLLEKIDKNIIKYIPEKIYEEVVGKGLERCESDAKYVRDLVESGFFKIKKCEINNLIKDVSLLGEADKEIVSLTGKMNAVTIIDEIYASDIAESLNIKTHGSLYIILKLVQEQKISKKEAVESIDKMIESGFYLSVEKYKEITEIIKKI